MTTTTPTKPARDEQASLTPAQVAEIVRHAPRVAAKMGECLTQAQIDSVVRRAPAAAARHLRDHLDLLHVAIIVRRAPRAAVRHLLDQLTADHVGMVHPRWAAYVEAALTVRQMRRAR